MYWNYWPEKQEINYSWPSLVILLNLLTLKYYLLWYNRSWHIHLYLNGHSAVSTVTHSTTTETPSWLFLLIVSSPHNLTSFDLLWWLLFSTNYCRSNRIIMDWFGTRYCDLMCVLVYSARVWNSCLCSFEDERFRKQCFEYCFTRYKRNRHVFCNNWRSLQSLEHSIKRKTFYHINALHCKVKLVGNK